MHAREEIIECAQTVDSATAVASVVYSSVVSTDGSCKALRGRFHGKQKIGHGGVVEASEYWAPPGLRLTYLLRNLLTRTTSRGNWNPSVDSLEADSDRPSRHLYPPRTWSVLLLNLALLAL